MLKGEKGSNLTTTTLKIIRTFCVVFAFISKMEKASVETVDPPFRINRDKTLMTNFALKQERKYVKTDVWDHSGKAQHLKHSKYPKSHTKSACV